MNKKELKHKKQQGGGNFAPSVANCIFPPGFSVKGAIFFDGILAQLSVGQGFAIGVQNLEVVDSRFGFVLVHPDNLFVPVDLD